MSCRTVTCISPLWLARRESMGRGKMDGKMTRGRIFVLVTPAEARSADTSAHLLTVRHRSANSHTQHVLRPSTAAMAWGGGRRPVPPEELEIVPQPRRERPPTWHRNSLGHRSQGVAHVSAAGQCSDLDRTRNPVGLSPRDCAPNMPPFVAHNSPESGRGTVDGFWARSLRCL